MSGAVVMLNRLLQKQIGRLFDRRQRTCHERVDRQKQGSTPGTSRLTPEFTVRRVQK
jgi:hypothetical protein